MKANNRGGAKPWLIYVAILVVWASVFAIINAGTCPGVCQPNTYSCPGSYKSGLCPGASNIECCEESTNCGSGQCQINTLSCPGGYKSGLCPGGNDIQCCEPSSGSGSGSGILGIDVSVAISSSDFNCIKSQGYNFTIVRAYRSNGVVDTNAPATIKNAWNAGIGRVDIYMFPCYSCGDPSGQVSDTVTYLQQNGAKYDAYWFDIENIDYWSTSKTDNQNFFESMVTEAQSLKQVIGVYTSESQWSTIMGDSYTYASKFPLWYAHYQIPPQPNFDDFSPFAGWTSPSVKQYSGDDTDCNVNIDLNYATNLDYTG